MEKPDVTAGIDPSLLLSRDMLRPPWGFTALR
jgi:hypothetical protein